MGARLAVAKNWEAAAAVLVKLFFLISCMNPRYLLNEGERVCPVFDDE